MENRMPALRVAIIGAGSIARIALEHTQRGTLGDAKVVALMGRSAASRGAALASEHGCAFVTTLDDLLASEPDVVVEAAGHAAVRAHAARVLERGLALVVLSCGALADDALRTGLEAAARAHGGLLYVPSGGICGLDAVKTMALAGLDEVSIAVTKPPAAWKGIAFVEGLGIDLDALREATVLYDGPVREGAGHFPANVNIAAGLALAGIGFDRTRLRVVADPALTRNTHFIEVRGKPSDISIRVANVPDPDNPKTAWLACYSALAAIREARSAVRYGT
jgi:aspartate dehydrogenase